MYLKIGYIDDDLSSKFIISSNLSSIDLENNEFDFIIEFNELNDLVIWYFTDDCDNTNIEQKPFLIISKCKIIKYNKSKIKNSKVLKYIESKLKNNDSTI